MDENDLNYFWKILKKFKESFKYIDQFVHVIAICLNNIFSHCFRNKEEY